MRRKRLLIAIYVCYLLILFRLIVFKYPFDTTRNILRSWEPGQVLHGIETANFTLFRSVKMYIRYFDRIGGFENLVGNVALFIPVGILQCAVRERTHRLTFLGVFLRCAAISIGIECFQLVSRLGQFDVDDILLNTFGAILGFAVYEGYHIACRRNKSGCE